MLQYNFNETQEMQWVSTAKINDVVRIGERRSGGFVGIFAYFVYWSSPEPLSVH